MRHRSNRRYKRLALQPGGSTHLPNPYAYGRVVQFLEVRSAAKSTSRAPSTSHYSADPSHESGLLMWNGPPLADTGDTQQARQGPPGRFTKPKWVATQKVDRRYHRERCQAHLRRLGLYGDPSGYISTTPPVIAILQREPTNPYDPNAVKVRARLGMPMPRRWEPASLERLDGYSMPSSGRDGAMKHQLVIVALAALLTVSCSSGWSDADYNAFLDYCTTSVQAAVADPAFKGQASSYCPGLASSLEEDGCSYRQAIAYLAEALREGNPGSSNC